jgi:hypothetical protein
MVPQKAVRNLSIENAKIRFRNFEGKEGEYNAKGKRNFCVFLDQQDAIRLKDDGWNVKWLKPRDPEEDPQAYLPVSVSFDFYPPKIVLIQNGMKTIVTEKSVKGLDWAEIKSVDLTIRPYSWDVSGKKGIKAYLNSMYVTVVEDEFAAKYVDVPDSVAGIGDDQPPWEE